MKTKILFLAMLLSGAMAISLSQANWSASASPEGDVVPVAYLPLIMKNYCPDYFDDFSNPASGWEVTNNPYYLSEYLNGEYHVLSKNKDYFYLFDAPACDRDNYTVEVDARWQGSSGYDYGIMFDLTDDYNNYYLFWVSSYYQVYALYMHTSFLGTVTIVPPTSSSTIHWGMASNHLGVTRDGDLITLHINGTTMGTWSQNTITGENGAGVIVRPYSDVATADARFDNFSMRTLPTTGVQNRDNIVPEVYESGMPRSQMESMPAPVDLD